MPLVILVLVVLVVTGVLWAAIKIAIGVALGILFAVAVVGGVLAGVLVWRIRRAVRGPRGGGWRRIRGSGSQVTVRHRRPPEGPGSR